MEKNYHPMRGYLDAIVVVLLVVFLVLVARGQGATKAGRQLQQTQEERLRLGELASVKGVTIILRLNRVTGRPECVLMKHYEDNSESGFTVSSKQLWKDTLSDCGASLDHLQAEITRAKQALERKP